MKKYIVIALLLVLGTAYPAYARWAVGMVGGGVVAAAGCTGCNSTNDGDVFNNNNTQVNTYFGGEYRAVQVTLAAERCITGLKLSVYDDGTAMTITGELWNNSGGNPSSIVGAGYTSSVSTLPDAAGTEVEFLFAATQTLAAGTYWIVVYAAGTSFGTGGQALGTGTYKYSSNGTDWSAWTTIPQFSVLGCTPS